MLAHHKQGYISISLSLILLILTLSNAFAQSTANAPAASARSHWLEDAFVKGAEALEEDIQAETNRAGEVQSSRAQTTGDLEELQLRVAMLKTAIEIKTISPPIVDEILKTFSTRDAELSSEANALTDEIKEIEKRRAKKDASQSAIEEQTQVIKGSESGIWSGEIELAYDKYKDAGSRFADASGELINELTEKSNLIKQEKDLLDEILPRLKSLQQDFMAKLLQRSDTKSFWEQLADMWSKTGALPGQGWQWFTGLLRSGSIQAFLL